MLKNINIAYKEILSHVIRARGGELSSKDNPMKVNMDKHNELLYNDDLTCAIRLFEAGYKVNDVIKVLKDNSPMIANLKNPRAELIYLDRVFENINREWTHKADNSFGVAQDSYRARMNNLMKKYEDYDKKNFGLYQDGEIALALVINEGFSPEIVEEVVKRNSPSPQRTDSTYLFTIRDSVIKTKERYDAIMSQNPDDSAESVSDIYRQQAKEYMTATKTTILSGSDEQKIVEKIYTNFIQNFQQNRPEFQGNIKKLDELVENTIKPYLRKAILEASPIYTEPGRDKDQYITSILSDFASNYETRKTMSSVTYPVAEELYVNKMKTLQNRVTSYIKNHDQTFMDGIAAKDLLEARQAPQNIKRAIIENSPVKLQEDTAFSSMQDYADFIISKARKSLHAEKEILNFQMPEHIPDNVPLRETGLSMKDMFQFMLRERVDKYPSFAFELTEPFADRDACEKLIHRYPDFDRLDLERAIADASPRAQLPGISTEYAKDIIRQAEERLARIDEYKKKETALQQEFNKLRGLSSEGVYENDNPMNSFKDGRIAVKMLKKNVSRDDIKKYIVALAQAASIENPFFYADKILTAASLVISKEKEIADYVPTEKGAASRSCMDIYLEKMNRKYQEKGFVDPSMDIKVMKEMMEETKFAPPQIKDIVLAMSPVAKEPGRDDGYGEYVMKQAILEKQKEEEKLKRYVITPRSALMANSAEGDIIKDKIDGLEMNNQNIKEELVRTRDADKEVKNGKNDCEEEYAFQREKMVKELGMDFSRGMEILLAGALLTAGFAKDEIADAIDNYALKNDISEFTSVGSASYGQEIMQEVESSIREETQSLSEEHVLTRTITTTTTTTTTTEFSDD